jgi:EmrB/QacA subfamily drug resistance transporter
MSAPTVAAERTPADHDARTAIAASNPHHERRWLILGVLALAQLTVVLDTTVVNIALPSAQKALAFSNTDRQWIVTAYALAFGSLLLLGGRLADLVGRKRVFITGLVGFALASAVGGAATGFGMLVTARAVQGAFGALLAPAALSLLTTTFTDAKERAKAFGIYGAIAGGGAGIGLLLGGVLTEYLSWRWCMYVNLIFAGAAVVGGSMLLHNRPAETRQRLDLVGIVTASAGLFSLVYGFSHAETGGWSDSVTIGFLAAGIALVIAFVVSQTKVANPLLPMRVVLDRNRGGAYLSIFMAGAGMFGVFLFLTYYLQQTLHFSAIRSGLAFLPMVGVIVVVSTLSSQILARRVGPKLIIPPGLAIATGGMLLLLGIDVHSSYATAVLPGTLVFGAGVGLVFSSAMSIATMGVDAGDAGVASAMVNTGQQVGGSIGTALLNTIAATAATHYLTAKSPTAANLAEATIHSYTTAFAWSAGIMATAAVLCGLLLRSEVPQIDPDAELVPAV